MIEIEDTKEYIPLSHQTYSDFTDDSAIIAQTSPVYTEERCPECWNTSEVEDSRSGDVICCGCGFVKESKSVSPEAEYRVFQDDDGDSQSKIRVGPSYNPYLPHNFLGSKRKWERDEKEFLWEGLKNIDEALSQLLADCGNKPVEARAKELFQKAFHWQFLQKQGIQSQVKAKLDTPIDKKNVCHILDVNIHEENNLLWLVFGGH